MHLMIHFKRPFIHMLWSNISLTILLTNKIKKKALLRNSRYLKMKDTQRILIVGRVIHRGLSIWETIRQNELKVAIFSWLYCRNKGDKGNVQSRSQPGNCKFLYKYVSTRHKINVLAPWRVPLLHFRKTLEAQPSRKSEQPSR